MADFRRVVTALAVLALLTGFAVTANAQATGPAFSCTASAAVPPLLRAEGLTELTGDVVLNCSGGVALTAGATAGQANITVFLGNTTVTSRILDTSNNASEALLLIDEPNTALSIIPPATTPTAFSLCTTPLTGCGAVVGSTKNVYQGIVSGNSVTFIGVPIVPPGSQGTRIFRVTNVRANASTVGAGPGGTPGQVQAFISISGSTSIPINNPTQIVGFVQTGLNFSVRKQSDNTKNISGSGLSFAQCNDLDKTKVAAFLRFAENFATAFKTQGNTAQTTPGAVYNTESGLVLSGFTTSTTASGIAPTAGLADFGTRLRATFANIPTGVNVWVSTTNINNGTTGQAAAGSATLTVSETGPFSAITATDTFRDATNTKGTKQSVAPVSLNAGAGTAVWEVQVANPLAAELYDFNVYLGFSANPGSNSPATGVTGTVAGSFAPAPPAIDATAGAKASGTLPIPRFIDTGSAKSLVSVFICRTNLLFPFVTNQAGFDTGLAIANTSQDPFGTTTQAGTCTLNFFGDNAPAAITTASLAAGKVTTSLASTSAPNFQGYVIAVCNFQFGHGFAFVSDLGARNLAMGYLALVIPDVPRSTNPVSDLVGGSVTGETLAQ